jgi:hypothetical protein
VDDLKDDGLQLEMKKKKKSNEQRAAARRMRRKALQAEIAHLVTDGAKNMVKKHSTKSLQIEDDLEMVSPSKASTAPSAAENKSNLPIQLK